MKSINTIPGHAEKGITLIELVLAVTVIVILMAVIIPRALRTNTEAKYVGVRQAAAEISRWGMDWSVRNLESQPYDATCNLNDYVETLLGYVGDTEDTNWTKPENADGANIDLTQTCREGADDNGITYTVSDMIPPESQPRNPFNGLSYFNTSGGNDGSRAQPGLLFLARHIDDDDMNHYYFIYTGTDSNTADDWHAGMGQGTEPGFAQLRNGIFMTRQIQRP